MSKKTVVSDIVWSLLAGAGDLGLAGDDDDGCCFVSSLSSSS